MTTYKRLGDYIREAIMTRTGGTVPIVLST